jgi:hypothetical protein
VKLLCLVSGAEGGDSSSSSIVNGTSLESSSYLSISASQASISSYPMMCSLLTFLIFELIGELCGDKLSADPDRPSCSFLAIELQRSLSTARYHNTMYLAGNNMLTDLLDLSTTFLPNLIKVVICLSITSCAALLSSRCICDTAYSGRNLPGPTKTKLNEEGNKMGAQKDYLCQQLGIEAPDSSMMGTPTDRWKLDSPSKGRQAKQRLAAATRSECQH